MDIDHAVQTLFWVAVVSALSPLLVALLPGPRIPQVVLLLVGGVIIGPQALAVADADSITILSDVGLGFLFLLAGYELDLTLFRDRPGRLAIVGWLVSVALALLVVGGLSAAGIVDAFVPVALGLTTTALGTLLPILRDNGMVKGPFGRYVAAAGAVGEILPVIAIALFLGSRSEFVALLSLAVVGVLALVLARLPGWVRGSRIERIFHEGELGTSQTTVRTTVVLLVLFLLIAQEVGLDVVLGAFLAGIVLRRFAPTGLRTLESKLDIVGYGFFIPIFFVCSGMGLDIRSIADAPLRLFGFFVLLLVVRGLPSLVVYRGRSWTERWEMVFITATALPLLVALTQIGLENGTMLPENAAALVGAGALSVLVFPMVAVALHKRRAGPVEVTIR